MSLASVGLYAAKWSRTIELEWIASIEKRRPDLMGKLAYRRDQMREAVLDWEVEDQACRSVQFIVTQWDLDQLIAVAAFKHMQAGWKKPEATANSCPS